RDRDLGQQIGAARNDRGGELRVLTSHSQDVPRRVAVAEGELGRRLLPHPPGRLQILRPALHPQRNPRRVAGRLPTLALAHPVDGTWRASSTREPRLTEIHRTTCPWNTAGYARPDE